MRAVAKYKRIFKIHIMSIVKGPQHYSFIFSTKEKVQHSRSLFQVIWFIYMKQFPVQ